MLRKLIKQFLMEEANGEGQGGGGALGDGGGKGGSGDGSSGSGQGGAAGSAGASGAGAGGAGSGDGGSGSSQGGSGTPAVSIPENWQEILPNEIRDQANIRNFKTVDSLAKAYIHAQKMVGADKIAISKNPSEAEIREVQERLGLPKEADKYEVKLADKSPLKKEIVDAFKKTAFEAGILPAQAQKLVDFMHSQEVENHNSQILRANQDFEKNMAAIHNEWGDAYGQMSAQAKAALKEFGATQDDINYFKQHFGANPTVLRFLSKVGGTLSEDKIKGEGGINSGAMTPNQALQKIAEIRANIKGPYFDPTHGDHAATKAEMKKLHEIAYPTKKK